MDDEINDLSTMMASAAVGPHTNVPAAVFTSLADNDVHRAAAARWESARADHAAFFGDSDVGPAPAGNYASIWDAAAAIDDHAAKLRRDVRLAPLRECVGVLRGVYREMTWVEAEWGEGLDLSMLQRTAGDLEDIMFGGARRFATVGELRRYVAAAAVAQTSPTLGVDARQRYGALHEELEYRITTAMVASVVDSRR